MLKCKECGMEIRMGKKVYFMRGKSYHPVCVKDNKNLYAFWEKAREGDWR